MAIQTEEGSSSVTNNNEMETNESQRSDDCTTAASTAHFFKRRDLAALDMCETPMWIFDMERKRMWWANVPALHVWNADSLDELLSRDFVSDMSDVMREHIDQDFARMKNGIITQNGFTFYPKDKPNPVRVKQSGKLIAIWDEMTYDDDEEQRYAALVECDQPGLMDHTKEELTRGMELLRHLPVTVSRYDIEGKLLYQNPEAVRVFGSEVDQLANSGRWSADSVASEKEGNTGGDHSSENPEDITMSLTDSFVDSAVAASVLETVASEKGFCRQEAQLITREGSRWFSISMRQRQDPIHTRPVILFSCVDINELVETRQENEALALKSEFLAVMAHEIRTPLHQVIGTIDLMCLTALDENQQDLMITTRSSTSLLMAIINDLLDFTKLEGGKVNLELISFNLRDVITSCLDAIRPAASDKSLVLSNEVDSAIPFRMMGDPNRVRQILLNLLQNAVKFTDAGCITVRVKQSTEPIPTGSNSSVPNFSQMKKPELGFRRATSKTGPLLRLAFEVIDTGIGIDASQQELVFKRYQQADATITRKYGGTGLGLAICKALVELMGGNISIHSTPGKGATFSFVLHFRMQPDRKLARQDLLDMSGHGGMRNAPTSMTSSEGEPLCILVAEDNIVNQKLISKMLSRLGHTCILAKNGQVALDKLQEGDVATDTTNDRIDLVLMDVQMPIMDGIEATKQIRTQLGKSKADLPILGLTASYQHSDLLYYQEIGMNSCMGKPLRLLQLKETLQAYQRTNNRNGVLTDNENEIC